MSTTSPEAHERVRKFFGTAIAGAWPLVAVPIAVDDGIGAAEALRANVRRGRAFIEVTVRLTDRGAAVIAEYCSCGAKEMLYQLAPENEPTPAHSAYVLAVIAGMAGLWSEALLRSDDHEGRLASVDAGEAVIEAVLRFARDSVTVEIRLVHDAGAAERLLDLAAKFVPNAAH